MVFGNSAQLPEGVLQSCTEALEALGKTDRTILPVRIGQDEVVEQMIKGNSPNSDPQTVHAGEI